jgi:hypothetical protein
MDHPGRQPEDATLDSLQDPATRHPVTPFPAAAEPIRTRGHMAEVYGGQIGRGRDRRAIVRGPDGGDYALSTRLRPRPFAA